MTPEDAEVAFYVGKVKAEGLGKTPQEAQRAGWQEVIDACERAFTTPDWTIQDIEFAAYQRGTDDAQYS